MRNDKESEEILIGKAVKRTIQILYDKGLFYNYNNADQVLKSYLLMNVNERRGPDLAEVKDDVVINDSIKKNNLKNKTTSNSKIQQILASLSLSDVGICLGDAPFKTGFGIVNTHLTKGTPWVAYIYKKDFDSYSSSPPNKLCRFIIKRNGHCLYFEY